MNTAQNSKSLVLDANLAQLATTSVEQAFEQLFGIQVKASSHNIIRGHVNKGDISGILGMVQNRMEATLTLSFDKPTVLGIMTKFYGEKVTDIDLRVRQGVGELTNIIYAMMKKNLNDTGHTFQMAIPNVVFGDGHSIVNIHEGRSLVIPFGVEGGKFLVEIAVQNDS